MRWRKRPGLALLLGLRACAAAACADVAPQPGETLQAYEQRLHGMADQCAQHPDYLVALGLALIELGQPEAGLLQLERALLLQPDHPVARRHYAQALRRRATDSLAAPIGADPPAPPEPPAWSARGSVGLALGYDDNLNRATTNRTIELSFPQGPYSLPLAPDARARAGHFYRAEADLSWQSLQGSAAWEAWGRVQSRHAAAADLSLAGAELLVQYRAAAGGAAHWSAHAGHAHTQWQGRTLQQAQRAGARWLQAPRGDCHHALGGELARRRHPGQAALDHHAAQIEWTRYCALDPPTLLQWALTRESGPQPRPGGSAWQLGARALAHWPLAHGARLQAEAQLSLRRTDRAYSPLLANGSRLRSATLGLRLEWHQPLAPAWQLVFSAEAERQRATVALFDLDRRALTVALRRHF